MRRLSALVAALLLTPGISQAKTLDELLVEKGVITKSEAEGVVDHSKVYWNGGTRLELPDSGFATQINTLIQTRYTFTDGDEDSGDKNTSSFAVRKARIALTGSALNEEFSYKIEGEFAGARDEDGAKGSDLTDAFVTWKPCNFAQLKMGQYKTNFSRQFNTSDQSLQFADRSVTSDFFSFGRNQGASAKLDLMEGDLVLVGGIYNGQSDGEGVNREGTDTNHLGIVSARWTTGGINALEEGDVGFTKGLGASVGAAYAYSQFNGGFAGEGNDGDSQNIDVDVIVKTMGLSVAAEYYWANDDIDVADTGSDSTNPNGFYAQAGYMLTKNWELAGRYALIDCDNGEALGVCSGNDRINQVTAGLNYYFWKHNLKAQLNYDLLNQDGAADGPESDNNDRNTNRWILQLSAYF